MKQLKTTWTCACTCESGVSTVDYLRGWIMKAVGVRFTARQCTHTGNLERPVLMISSLCGHRSDAEQSEPQNQVCCPLSFLTWIDITCWCMWKSQTLGNHSN